MSDNFTKTEKATGKFKFDVKLLVGIFFVIFGIFLAFNAIKKNNTNYVDYSYKYDQQTAHFVKATASGNRYNAYYEYEYNDNVYNAIYDKTFANENDIPKTQVIQVNMDNPEDYVFGTNERPRVDTKAFVIPGVIMLFGFLSIALTLLKII